MQEKIKPQGMEGGRDPSNLSHSSKQKSRASTGLKPAVYSGLEASKSAVRVVVVVVVVALWFLAASGCLKLPLRFLCCPRKLKQGDLFINLSIV